MIMDDVIIYVLFAFLIVMAIAIVRLHDLFAAVMLTGVFSLLSAALFTVMDAVDVAFTEAAVGAGISTILMLGTLGLTRHQEKEDHAKTHGLALMIVTIVGAAFIYGTLDMPPYGDPNAPIHRYLAPEYLEDGLEGAAQHAAHDDHEHDELHAALGHEGHGHGGHEGHDHAEKKIVGLPNVVTSVLGSYRGYDTFGETTVIFTAGIGVILLLGMRRSGPAKYDQNGQRLLNESEASS